MTNSSIIYQVIFSRLGSNTHVGVEPNSNVSLLVNDPLFISAVHKMDVNKNISPFVTPLQRTDAETAFLNQIVDCMRECQLLNPEGTITLLHPFNDDKVLFSTK